MNGYDDPGDDWADVWPDGWHGDGPPPDWRPTPVPPAGDGPAPLEYLALVADHTAEQHPAVAAVIAAAQLEQRRRRRRRTTRLEVVR